jgi:hypothetical protein
MTAKSETRPLGITALSIFFLFGTAASFVSFVSLLFPGSFLEPMWRLNPRAREGFASMGAWAIVLMFAVCIACAGSGGSVARRTMGIPGSDGAPVHQSVGRHC